MFSKKYVNAYQKQKKEKLLTHVFRHLNKRRKLPNCFSIVL